MSSFFCCANMIVFYIYKVRYSVFSFVPSVFILTWLNTFSLLLTGRYAFCLSKLFFLLPPQKVLSSLSLPHSSNPQEVIVSLPSHHPLELGHVQRSFSLPRHSLQHENKFPFPAIISQTLSLLEFNVFPSLFQSSGNICFPTQQSSGEPGSC